VLPAILEQKVTGREARSSFRRIVRAFGEPAPGPFGDGARAGRSGSRSGSRSATPFGVRLLPSPERIAATPPYAFHRFGVEARRAAVIRAVAAIATRLNDSARPEPESTRKRMRSIPGIGPWTEAEVARVAFGDADAVSVGDFHLPSAVSWALAWEARADDARMLELLEPYRGQRGRRRGAFTMNSPPPRPPQRVPTLTEVIRDLPKEPAAPAEPSAPPRDAEIVPEALLAEVWLQESRIAAKVIERLQPRIDVLFEHRLREALAPLVARIAAAVADEARKELAHRLREAVEQAINEELGRHRDT
jgi:hypothetical protein